jgi:hypothetical protein
MIRAGWLLFYPVLTHACSFVDDGTSDLAIHCSSYSVTMSRENGALTSISSSSGIVSRGSHGGCLFGMSGPNDTYCGSCGCTNGGPTSSYRWNAPSLSWRFDASVGAGTTSLVTLTVYDEAPFFDLTFELLEAPSEGSGYFWLLFPSEILFDTTGKSPSLHQDSVKKTVTSASVLTHPYVADIQALHVPILPGVSLSSGFFARGVSTNWYYPGSGSFAGWTHVDGANGSLAIYDLRWAAHSRRPSSGG